MNMKTFIAVVVCMFLSFSCNNQGNIKNNKNRNNQMTADSTMQYGYNIRFLKNHVKVVELKSGTSAVAIVPAWQGRVMTSTSGGVQGFSFGWINRQLISSENPVQHINPYGGEERIWLGPEGGQFSIFFKKGDEFVYDNWQTPDFLDTLPYEVTAISDTAAEFSHDAEIVNYSGTLLRFRIERKVSLIAAVDVLEKTGIDVEGLNCVAYRSENRLINRGTEPWEKETGLLSVWMLGMFNPSPAVIIVIPFSQGTEKDLGVPVNDNYFGKIAPDRLRIAGNNIYFRADGKSRGKIGLSPQRATGIMGSFDFENNILTLLLCKLPQGTTDYVNSAWQIQDHPYSGDAFNSYNDGPLEDGSQMGPFYELETSSPAAELKPEEGISHIQVTMHLIGSYDRLDAVSRSVLGVTLEEIKKVFD